MSVEYRTLRPGEEEAACGLWAEVYGIERDFARREYLGSPNRRPEHTRVAVDADGALLSTVHYVLRDLRRPDGGAWRVGGIANVATREDARRQGHSGRLLEMTIQALEDEGCEWSHLFTGVNRHYERYGWRTLPTRYRQGLLAPAAPAAASPYAVRRYHPQQEPGGWEALAAVYAAYNAARPLTTVRSLAYWQSFSPLHFTAPNALLLACEREAGWLAGYLLARFDATTFGAIEVGAMPGEEAAIGALVGVLGEVARERGVVRGRAYLPVEPRVDASLARLFGHVEAGHHASVMVRAIAAGFDVRAVEEAYALPGAVIWPADDF